MANHVLLNNIDHKDLKVITEKSAQYGDNKMCSVIFPIEFRHAQAYYPIFFHIDSQTQQISALAIFGFEQNENLFLTNDGWDAAYIPLMVEREPFLIGYQNTTEAGKDVKNTVIHIDLDSPKVSKTQGQSIFLEHGGNSDYLAKISATLKTIQDSQVTTDLFMQTLKEHDLLEPFNLDIELRDGSNNRLTGYHTIKEEKLFSLSAEVLEKLNKTGLLTIIYMVIASQENVRILAAKKDKLIKL
jgi:hypothetical protein